MKNEFWEGRNQVIRNWKIVNHHVECRLLTLSLSICSHVGDNWQLLMYRRETRSRGRHRYMLRGIAWNERRQTSLRRCAHFRVFFVVVIFAFSVYRRSTSSPIPPPDITALAKVLTFVQCRYSFLSEAASRMEMLCVRADDDDTIHRIVATVLMCEIKKLHYRSKFAISSLHTPASSVQHQLLELQ